MRYRSQKENKTQRNTKKSTGKKPKSPPKNPKDGFQWQRAGKTSLIWLSIIAISIFLSGLFTENARKEVEIDYFQYREFMTQKLISKALIIEDTFHGELKLPQNVMLNYGQTEVSKFYLKLPFIDRETMEDWDQYDIEYSFRERSIDWTGYLLNMLPWILLIAFWLFIMRRMQGGAGGMKGVFNFGKSRAKLWNANLDKVTFNNVAGCVEAKDELKEIIEFLKHPKRFQKLGAKIPRGVLLVGPPGTGKTLLARAVAGEANTPFYSLSGADFVEMFVGVGASRVRDLFEEGKKNSPCIIFIDELDAVGRQRGAGIGGGHDEREQTLNQLLVEMDGFEANLSIILMAATNRPDVLDPALLRPGRFDRQVIVDAPDIKGRLGVLNVHVKNIVINKRKVRLEEIAKGTPGMVGADLANIVNEAALLAAKKRKQSVDMEDFEEAKDKVMMGVQRKSLVLTEKDKRVTAYHEAGHALVAVITPDADPVHKVTIIPRGRALGLTMQLPIDEKHGYTKSFIEGRLAIMMGGRAAEELIFQEMTTGAGNDIDQATNIARRMVCEWGMSDILGPMTFGKKSEEIFLGREIQSHRDFSENTARMIDEEVSRIIREAQESAEKIIKDNRDKLERMAEELLKYETIDGRDIVKIMNGQKIIRRNNTTRRPRRNRPYKKPSGFKSSKPAEILNSPNRKKFTSEHGQGKKQIRPKNTDGNRDIVKNNPGPAPKQPKSTAIHNRRTGNKAD